MTGIGLQSFAAVLIVLGLVAALAWLLRRGALGPLRPGGRVVMVETAVPLGERRSLVIVAVEGRRLLLGMTPAQISMVAELGPAPPAPVEPGMGGPAAPSFEHVLVTRAKDIFGRRGSSADGSGTRCGAVLQLGAD